MTPDHSHEPVQLARYHAELRNRGYVLCALSLACLCGGGLIVFALVKALLA